MKNIETKPSNYRRLWQAAWLILIVAAAAAAGMFVFWRAAGLNDLAGDGLMRARGELPEPENIIIVAIDETSIARLGRFPWRRGLAAEVLKTVSAGEPKAIALDVLYSEPSEPAEDCALTEAVANAGNVVIGEQLVENRQTPELSRSEWLRSLPELERAAAGQGHVNVETERDGAARQLLLKLADDQGEPRWALALEAVRVGDHLTADEINETDSFVRLGQRKIPFERPETNLSIRDKDSNAGSMIINRPLRMMIDYIGPTGSMTAQTVSFSDVLEGRVAAERFRGKYVLIGATAATLGDRISTPFVHTENAEGDQHGDLMPGVEILANSIDTIVRGRFVSKVSDLTVALCSVLTAVAVIFLLWLAQGKFEFFKQLGALAGFSGLIFYLSYLTYTTFLITPPLVPMLVSLIVAAPLAILRRSLAASAGLDEQITGLILARERLFTNGRRAILPELSERLSKLSENRDLAGNDFAGGLLLPRGIESKTRTLGSLQLDLIERSLFIDSALRSITDGLLIADCEGLITFVNQRALEIFSLSERRLLGSSIFEIIPEIDDKKSFSFDQRHEILLRLLSDLEIIEQEITTGQAAAAHYLLRLRAVTGSDHEREAIGLIVTLSDITKHRELQKTKNDVIALVTHELRTPLTAIQGMSEILTFHDVDSNSQKKMLTMINTEAKRLARMVNEYLDITRLESGTGEIQLTYQDIEALIEQSLLMLDPLAGRRGITILRHFEAVQPSININAELLMRAVNNIVGNSLKFSPAGTTVTIETHNDDQALIVTFTDQGCGISAAQLPHIFEKFYRGSRRRTDEEVAGTGLGLALTKEIVERHGGRLSAESVPNKGTSIRIHLPYFS